MCTLISVVKCISILIVLYFFLFVINIVQNTNIHKFIFNAM